MSGDQNEQGAEAPQAPSGNYDLYGFIISVLLFCRTLPGFISGTWHLCHEYFTALGQMAKMSGCLQNTEAQLANLVKYCKEFFGQENIARNVERAKMEHLL